MAFHAFKVKNIPPPGKKRIGDWTGMTVRTKRSLQNSLAAIPAGTICVVTGIGNGLELTAAPCKCCGVSIIITRVHGSDVEPTEG